MDYKNFDDDRFPYSRERSRIEYFKCFYNPSKLGAIKGKELLRLEKEYGESPDWDYKRRAAWLFFYRPYDYGKVIGRTQRSYITKLENEKAELAQKIILNKFLIWVFILLGMISIIPTFGSKIIVLVMVPWLFAFSRFYDNDGLAKKVKDKSSRIAILNEEIDCLLEQRQEMLNSRFESDEIEDMFWRDIVCIEKNYLKDTGELKNTSRNFYENLFKESGEFIIPPPQYPVVPSWGLLQSSYKNNPDVSLRQRTGLRIAANDIKAGVSTWRNAGKDKPIFRLWYIQFLFFHEKNLSVMSFYYDLITEKIYSEHIETYQYNHITNYSFNDEDTSFMVDDPVMEEFNIPKELTKNIFGDKVKTISLSSASGLSYRCVLPDRDVKVGMNRWLHLREESISKSLAVGTALSEKEKMRLKKEFFEISGQRKSLIDTLAWLAFKELRDSVAKFALVDIHEQ